MSFDWDRNEEHDSSSLVIHEVLENYSEIHYKKEITHIPTIKNLPLLILWHYFLPGFPCFDAFLNSFLLINQSLKNLNSTDNDTPPPPSIIILVPSPLRENLYHQLSLNSSNSFKSRLLIYICIHGNSLYCLVFFKRQINNMLFTSFCKLFYTWLLFTWHGGSEICSHGYPVLFIWNAIYRSSLILRWIF